MVDIGKVMCHYCENKVQPETCDEIYFCPVCYGNLTNTVNDLKRFRAAYCN